MHADEVFVYGKCLFRVLYDFKAAAAATYKLLVGLQQLMRILVHSYESKGKCIITVSGEKAYNTSTKNYQPLLKAKAFHSKVKTCGTCGH